MPNAPVTAGANAMVWYTLYKFSFVRLLFTLYILARNQTYYSMYILYIVYSIQYTVYTIRYTVYVQYTLYTIQYTIYVPYTVASAPVQP